MSVAHRRKMGRAAVPVGGPSSTSGTDDGTLTALTLDRTRFWSLARAARELGCRAGKVQRLLEHGEVRGATVGARTVVDGESVLAYAHRQGRVLGRTAEDVAADRRLCAAWLAYVEAGQAACSAAEQLRMRLGHGIAGERQWREWLMQQQTAQEQEQTTTTGERSHAHTTPTA